MALLDELIAKEAELKTRLTPLREELERLSLELEMTQHGIARLQSGSAGIGRVRWTKELLKQVEEMRAKGKSWKQVGDAMGVDSRAASKAFEKHAKKAATRVVEA